jgi:hypothetical protein
MGMGTWRSLHFEVWKERDMPDSDESKSNKRKSLFVFTPPVTRASPLFMLAFIISVAFFVTALLASFSQRCQFVQPLVN